MGGRGAALLYSLGGWYVSEKHAHEGQNTEADHCNETRRPTGVFFFAVGGLKSGTNVCLWNILNHTGPPLYL